MRNFAVGRKPTTMTPSYAVDRQVEGLCARAWEGVSV
jgi:hypothetical protein